MPVTREKNPDFALSQLPVLVSYSKQMNLVYKEKEPKKIQTLKNKTKLK